MDKRDGFVFYRSFFEAIMELPKEARENVFEAICQYALEGEEPEMDGITRAMFMLAKPQIDANTKRYQNGKKGGHPVTKEEPNFNLELTKEEPKPNQEVTKEEPNSNREVTEVEPKEKDKEKDKDKDKKKSKKEKESTPAEFVASLDEPEEVKERLREFFKMREKKKAPVTVFGAKLLYGKLLKYGNTTEEKCAVIEQSISGGWTGLYELKSRNGPVTAVKKNSFHIENQNQYDFNELERALTGG